MEMSEDMVDPLKSLMQIVHSLAIEQTKSDNKSVLDRLIMQISQ